MTVPLAKPRRSVLYMPASNAKAVDKARTLACDAVILDLEDAVPADAKDAARGALAIGFTHKPVIVRINGVGTPWHAADLAALGTLRPAAVMLPKAEDVASVLAIARYGAVVALIETAKGVANARALAGSGAVCRLAFGSIDLAADLGCEHGREALAYARGEFVLASNLGRLPPPLDGVTTDIADGERVADDARHARRLGFGGKLIVHPAQVGAVLGAFRPSAEQAAWARRVLASGDGAGAVDGSMVDEPVRKQARSILQRCDAAGEHP